MNHNPSPPKTGLSETDQEVFRLMSEARKQYNLFVDNVQTVPPNEYVVPSANDYSMEHPLGYCAIKE